MGFFDGDDKTEAPTTRRREKARDEGTVAHGQELPSIAALAMALAALGAAAGGWRLRWSLLWSDIGVALGTLGPAEDDFLSPIRRGLIAVVLPFLPILLAAAIGALVVGWGQTRLMFSGRLIRPDFSRLNPLTGLGRLISTRGWVQALYLLLKAVGLAWVAVGTFRAFQNDGAFYADLNAPALAERAWDLTYRMLRNGVILLSVFAAWDYARERRRVDQELRMTKQEVKEENRETDGNPQIKGRIRQLMRKMAGRRMMSRVPQADVVITNPTHLAVALRYQAKMKAPEVVAKGADLVAQRIREIAAAHGVPLMENKPLAQLLYKKVEVGGRVPVSLYQAVAEVLAYVYRRKGVRT